MSAHKAQALQDSEPSKNNPTLLDYAEIVLTLAKQKGADQADAVVSRSTDFEVKVADGEIVTLTQATSKGLGLRIFVEGRLGFCTLSDFNREALEHAVERAVEMAKQTTPDPHNGLVSLEPGHIDGNGNLDQFDPNIQTLSAEEKIRWAHALEREARSVDPRIKKFRDSGVSTSVGESVFATSFGASRTHRGTSIWLWCNPLAEADGELQTEVWYDGKTHLADLESVETVGRTAGSRAVRMLGAKRVKTQHVPVIFEPQMAAGLFAGMLGALDGDMVYKKASFLSERLHSHIATPNLSLIDDPLRPRGVASSLFDGEGLRTTKKRLVDHGKLTTFLYDVYTARKAGVQPTGNAQRGTSSLPHAGVFNFYAEAGTDSPEEILKSAPRALYVTRGLGRGLNTVSGEYSRGANGLWLEHGEVIHPVQEVTIAGDFVSMLENIDRIGSDLTFRGSTGAPTIRIAEMTVSGS